MPLKHEICQVAHVSKYCRRDVEAPMCCGISGASFVAISEGHIRIFCSSALSEFLTAAIFVERIT